MKEERKQSKDPITDLSKHKIRSYNTSPIKPIIGSANEKHKTIRAYSWMMLSRIAAQVQES